MIRRSLMLLYALGAYTLGIVSLLYIMGFLSDFAVPKGISGEGVGDGTSFQPWSAVLINSALIGLFSRTIRLPPGRRSSAGGRR